MSERQSWGVIGYRITNGKRNIGAEVERQLSKPEVIDWHNLFPLAKFIMNSAGVWVPKNEDPTILEPTNYARLEDIDELPDVTFVAIPSYDDGIAAYEYISHILSRGKKVVTAEKGALANFFGELKEESEDFRNLGIRATVGGGTRLMELARNEYCYDRKNVTQIHLVVNGTMTFILSARASGSSIGQAVQEAVDSGYAEPQENPNEAPDVREVIRGEAMGDIPKKVSIFFNRVGFSDEILNWKNLVQKPLTRPEIDEVLEMAKKRRYIVSIYSADYAETHKCPEEHIIGGFEYEHDSWLIVGGFRDLDRNALFDDLAKLTGAENGMVVGIGPGESDGAYTAGVGPGAGRRPTVTAMLDDYLHMFNIRP